MGTGNPGPSVTNDLSSSDALDHFIIAMPKAELHLHLEGTVQAETLRALAVRHGVDLPAADDEQLRRFYAFRDFPHFIDVFRSVCECLREPTDFERIVLDL